MSIGLSVCRSVGLSVMPLVTVILFGLIGATYAKVGPFSRAGRDTMLIPCKSAFDTMQSVRGPIVFVRDGILNDVALSFFNHLADRAYDHTKNCQE